MLVITRRPGEGIFIGDDIFVRVLSIERNQVRVGINAPRSILIAREEKRVNISGDGKAAPGDESASKAQP